MRRSSRFTGFCLASFSLGQLISIFGDRLNQFAIVGMIGKIEPGSSLELMKLSIFTFVPVLLLGAVIGAFLDKWNRAVVMVAADAFRGLVVLSLPFLFDRFDTLYAFYVPVMFLSIANMYFSPAKSAIVPDMVEASSLMKINAVLWAIGIISTITGFVVGGWIFEYRSWKLAFYSDGASYLLSVILLFPLIFLPKVKERPRTTAVYAGGGINPIKLITSIASSIKDSIRLIGEDRVIGLSLLAQTSLFALAGLLYVIGIAHIQSISPEHNSMYLAATGTAGTIGLLLGSAVAARYRGQLSGSKTISISMMVIGIALIGIAKSKNIVSLSIWSATVGIATSPLIVFTETLLQRYIPENFRGRVFAAREVLTKTAFLALSIIGTIIDMLISKAVILVSIGLFLALSAIVLERKRFLPIDNRFT